jgi:hypothetical protein
VNIDEGRAILTLSRLERPTCHLQRNVDGVWKGQWLDHERIPIEFIPLGEMIMPLPSHVLSSRAELEEAQPQAKPPASTTAITVCSAGCSAISWPSWILVI